MSDFGEGNLTLLHLFDKGAVDGTVGEIVVDAGGQRFARGFFAIGGDAMRFVEHLQAVAVGSDEAGEAPLLGAELFRAASD